MTFNSKIFLTSSVKPDTKSRVIAEIFVDEKNELSESDELKKYELVQGSIAYVIKSGELFIMDSDGLWHSPSGEAIS